MDIIIIVKVAHGEMMQLECFVYGVVRRYLVSLMAHTGIFSGVKFSFFFVIIFLLHLD